MRLNELFDYTEIKDYAGDLTKDVAEITYDSRQVRSGTLFIAVAGYKTDGHLFIKNAVEKGAAAVVIEDARFQSDEYTWIMVPNSRKALADLSAAIYGFPSSKLNIIGVTGTNGKTTTTNLIAIVLERAGRCPGLIGTLHNRIGKEIIPVSHTTPEAPDLQKLFADFLDKGADYAVMEVSSHALDLYRVTGTEFDVAVFTNLTQDHLDFHRDMEHYFAAKGRLFSGLGVKSNKKRRKFAIINIDDPYANELLELISVPAITYGIQKEADVRAEDVKVSDSGASFKLRYTNKTLPINLKMTGIFNVYNALAAAAVGLVEGVAVEEIIDTLENVDGIPGRFEKVDAGQNFTVIVDYSHTPDGLENCLKTAKEFAQNRVITVFGCGGDRDRKKRPLMGEVAGRLSDFVIVTSDNPRTEEAESIIAEILPGLERTGISNNYLKIADRKEAIKYAVNIALPQDVVIIAGKGHETYQIIGDRVMPFDDRTVAREAILERIEKR